MTFSHPPCPLLVLPTVSAVMQTNGKQAAAHTGSRSTSDAPDAAILAAANGKVQFLPCMLIATVECPHASDIVPCACVQAALSKLPEAVALANPTSAASPQSQPMTTATNSPLPAGVDRAFPTAPLQVASPIHGYLHNACKYWIAKTLVRARHLWPLSTIHP